MEAPFGPSRSQLRFCGTRLAHIAKTAMHTPKSTPSKSVITTSHQATTIRQTGEVRAANVLLEIGKLYLLGRLGRFSGVWGGIRTGKFSQVEQDRGLSGGTRGLPAR